MSDIMQEISAGLTYAEAEALLQETLDKILSQDMEPAMQAIDKLDKSLGGELPSLGRLPQLLLEYLTARGKDEAEELKPATFIFCADHGIARQGVSAYPPETTYQMAQNYLLPKGGAANAFSDYAGSKLYVVDMGMNLPEEPVLPGIIDCRLDSGTKNFTEGPAMSREQAMLAVAYGIKMAQLAHAKGKNVLLPGEMGISNTTAQACLAAVFCGLTPEEATGRGSRISEERLARKQQAVRTALTANGFIGRNSEKASPRGAKAIDVLAKVGGFEFGAMAGLMLGGAALRMVTILDGANTAAAALVAQSICPRVVACLLPSHLGGEKSHRHTLEKLGLKPYLTLGLNLSEACGSSILLRFLGTALLLLKRAQEHQEAINSQGEAVNEDFDDEDYDGGSDEETGLPIDETALGAGGLHISFMDSDAPEVTDKTFDFYLKTMPDLDKETFEAAKARLDSLAKPRYSLGSLEDLAAEFAGAVREPLPPYDPPSSVLLISPGPLSEAQSFLSDTFASSFESDLVVARLREGLPLTAYFNFGREKAEEISFDLPLLVLTMGELEGKPLGTAAETFAETLLTDSGKLAYAADEFLQHTPPDYHGTIAALMGAILAAAHNSSLVFIGDPATDIIARYTEQLCPDIRPYVLHPEPRLMQMGIKAPGGLTGCLSLHILEASLSALNNMKTFEETKVSLALDN
ncbi:nicotinate-nucleotide--dimethylbenzimidazole phosphoribosyltransferase [Selenomonas sp. KH1T6]|uniref:nicotinate-nucleotide--dimethylbenzimidazole phosphoribosyltransferase n=1 Tax=Selenomonas sp. KH1T6 TaxID=3158784 RepID=UPI0008A7B45C|nr:nicotinate-nucleotide--dimethylbenzimidazole phosphoribosyltransferase [Selenomonas ruminantium]